MASNTWVRDALLDAMLNWHAYENASGEDEIEAEGLRRTFDGRDWTWEIVNNQAFELVIDGQVFTVHVSQRRT